MVDKQVKLIEAQIEVLRVKITKAEREIAIFNAEIGAFQHALRIIRGEQITTPRS
jgi:hypothetical protein